MNESSRWTEEEMETAKKGNKLNISSACEMELHHSYSHNNPSKKRLSAADQGLFFR